MVILIKGKYTHPFLEAQIILLTVALVLVDFGGVD